MTIQDVSTAGCSTNQCISVHTSGFANHNVVKNSDYRLTTLIHLITIMMLVDIVIKTL